MKKKLIFLLCLINSLSLFAQEKMYIHKSDNFTLGALLTDIDSMYFGTSEIFLNVKDTSVHYSLSDIDSISFADNSDTVYVNYNGTSASVTNPLAFEGVSVSVTGAYVIVTATDEAKDVNYNLSGTATEGIFKIYSEKKFNLLFDGVNITNPAGPAINIQSGKKISVALMDGTTNILTDGSSYADSLINDAGKTEDQDAAFFSEGKLVFNGSGSLTINGKGSIQHALCSDDLIQIEGGTITVVSASKDGIHANDGIVVTGGTINVTATGEAIDGDKGYISISGGAITTKSSAADADGITCDSTIVISDGTINITVNGDKSKGIISGKDMTLSGGNIIINTSGNAVLEVLSSGYDPAYCTGIKCDSTITISGATITITSTGKGGKGISSDSNIVMTSGNLKITTSGAGATYKNSSGITDCYHATCISSNGNISILGGSVTTSSTGAAGKGITANGILAIGDANNSPELNITTTGAKITISGTGMNKTYAEAKAVSCDGAITVNNGIVTISSADDGIKSTASVTINNGTVSISKSVEGIESPYITVNSGTVSIAASDDGFNATKGNGGEQNDGSCLYLNGGNVYVNVTSGDGLDSNGSIVMSGGTVVVHGPQSQPEVGTDYNGTFNISGGFLILSGPNSGNMIEATSSSSSQYSVKATTSSMLAVSTLFHIQDASGNDLVTFKPIRNLYYIVFSSPDLKNGSTYSIYTGGTSTGTYSNGLYTGGVYSGGTLKKTFTISGKVTNVSF